MVVRTAIQSPSKNLSHSIALSIAKLLCLFFFNAISALR